MATAEQVKNKIRGLIELANRTTGSSDDNLTDAVGSLMTGYGGTINAASKTYKVMEGFNVAAGDFVELRPAWGEGSIVDGAVGVMTVVPLTASKAVVVYTVSTSLYAVLLSADGESVTKTEPVTIATNALYTGPITAATLTADKVLVAFGKDTLGPNMGTGHTVDNVVLTVTDTSIAAGEVQVFDSGVTDMTLVAMTDSKALIVYRDTTSYGYARALTVNGTTITSGTAINFDSSFRKPAAVKMTDSHVLVAYETYDGTYGRAIVLACPSTTVTKGNVYTFRSAASSDLALTALDQRRAVLVYRDAGSTGYLYATVLQVSDATVTTQNSPSLQLTSYGGSKPAVTRIGTDTVLMVANFIGSSSEKSARAQVLTIGESRITKTELSLYDTTTQNEMHTLVTTAEGVALLVSDRAAATEYRGLTVNGTTVTKQTQGGTRVVPITSEKYPVGVTRLSGEGGATVYVFRAGTSVSAE